jgi:hypothetical protein
VGAENHNWIADQDLSARQMRFSAPTGSFDLRGSLGALRPLSDLGPVTCSRVDGQFLRSLK